MTVAYAARRHCASGRWLLWCDILAGVQSGMLTQLFSPSKLSAIRPMESSRRRSNARVSKMHTIQAEETLPSPSPPLSNKGPYWPFHHHLVHYTTISSAITLYDVEVVHATFNIGSAFWRILAPKRCLRFVLVSMSRSCSLYTLATWSSFRVRPEQPGQSKPGLLAPFSVLSLGTSVYKRLYQHGPPNRESPWWCGQSFLMPVLSRLVCLVILAKFVPHWV